MMLLLVATTGRVWASEEVEDEPVADVEDESVDTAQLAHLVIRKSVSEDLPVVGSDVTVKLEIFNPGTSAAYGVEVHDVPFQPMSPTATGAPAEGAVLDARFATVPAGGNVTHKYTFVVKGPGYLFGPPAKAQYRPSMEATGLQSVRSTGVQLRIISRTEWALNTAVLVGTYASLGVLKTRVAWRNFLFIAAGFAVFLGSVSAHRSMKDAQRRRKARAAEAALLKAE